MKSPIQESIETDECVPGWALYGTEHIEVGSLSRLWNFGVFLSFSKLNITSIFVELLCRNNRNIGHISFLVDL